MYARESCLDPTTELDCNDDIDFGAGLSQSRLRLNLVADQTVYLFIDTYNDETLTAGAFTLTAKPFVMTNPPTLNEAILAVNVEDSTVGVSISGNDPESDTLAVGLQLFNDAGEPLFQGDGISIPLDNVDHDDMGNFTGTVLLPLNGDLSIVAEGDVRAVDAEGQQSMAIRVMPTTPMAVARGEACNGITAVCDADSVCVDSVCGDPAEVAACPEDWPVNTIEADMDGNAVVQGNNSDSEGGFRAGSCGGGSKEIFFLWHHSMVSTS